MNAVALIAPKIAIIAAVALLAFVPVFAYNAGNTPDPDRALELRHIYGNDDIYHYAAWLEANGGLSDQAKTTIHNSTVAWTFADSKDNTYSWSMPIITYENLIGYSHEKSTYQHEIAYKTFRTSTGNTITAPNFDGFVTGSFDQVIDSIYDNAENEYDFVHEVWYIVSQMTVYDEDVDVNSEGRFALETFTRGGGDCEDLAILVADMLKSSSHSNDWKIQLVYMDTDRPNNPQKVDHVVVYVEMGEYSVIIEATGEPTTYSDYSYYPDGIRGWFYDV